MKKQRTMDIRVGHYLAYRRSLGYPLVSAGFVLRNFARFADRMRHRGPVTPRIVMRWLAVKPASPDFVVNKLSAVRGFAKYLALRDGRSQVPDTRLMPRGRRKRPHIYTPAQIRQLLAATGRLRFQHDLGPLTYRTLFGLLASTGLRISEATGLCCRHVDLQQGVLHIERAKFHKHRVVPLHATVAHALRRFALIRDKRWGMHPEQRFFLNSRGLALTTESAQDRFRHVCDALGWHQGNGEMRRPRLHDLRHTFACHRIQQWYQEGRNLHPHLNALATYLGHVNVTSTYWYLTATPELLETAGRRFERFAVAAEVRSS